MGNGAKIGLVGVLALIVLVVAIWDNANEGGPRAELPALPTASPDTDDAYAGLAPLPQEPDADGVRGEVDPGEPVRLDRPTETDSPVVAAAEERADGDLEIPAAVEIPPLEGAAQAQAQPQPQPRTAERSAPRQQATASSASSSGSAAPRSSEGQTYTVAPGDTLTRISARFYGSPNHYLRIARANREVIPDPDRLRLGVTIVIPDLDGDGGRAQPQPQRISSGGSGQTYVVKEGETLYQIAGRLLGSGARYEDIFAANRDRLRSPDAIYAGMQIVIPAE